MRPLTSRMAYIVLAALLALSVCLTVLARAQDDGGGEGDTSGSDGGGSGSGGGSPPDSSGTPDPEPVSTPNPDKPEKADLRVTFAPDRDTALSRARILKKVNDEEVVDEEASLAVCILVYDEEKGLDYYPESLESAELKAMDGKRAVFVRLPVNVKQLTPKLCRQYEFDKAGDLDAVALLDWNGNILEVAKGKQVGAVQVRNMILGLAKKQKEYIRAVESAVESAAKQIEKEKYTAACKAITPYEEASGFEAAQTLSTQLGTLNRIAGFKLDALYDMADAGNVNWKSLKKKFEALADTFPGTEVADTALREIERRGLLPPCDWREMRFVIRDVDLP